MKAELENHRAHHLSSLPLHNRFENKPALIHTMLNGMAVDYLYLLGCKTVRIQFLNQVFLDFKFPETGSLNENGTPLKRFG